METKHVQSLLHGYLDGELDLVTSLQIEEHLRSCPSCAQDYRNFVELRLGLREAALVKPAPADLRKRVHASLRKADREAAGKPALPWRTVVAVAALVGILLAIVGLARGWFATGGVNPESGLVAEIQSAHVRSLMASHLTDVASSDQHTVKPWFSGKLDFSPPVVDLAGQGYALIGGRLDYLEGHPVAALVYQHNKHFINLFIWPSVVGGNLAQITTQNGYHLTHWDQGGMTYWAISDMAASELDDFTKLVRENFK